MKYETDEEIVIASMLNVLKENGNEVVSQKLRQTAETIINSDEYKSIEKANYVADLLAYMSEQVLDEDIANWLREHKGAKSQWEQEKENFDLISSELNSLSEYHSSFVSEFRSLLILTADEKIGLLRDPVRHSERNDFKTVIEKLSIGKTSEITDSEWNSFNNIIKGVFDDILYLSNCPPVEKQTWSDTVLKSGKYIDFIDFKVKYQSIGVQYAALVQKMAMLDENLTHRRSLSSKMFDCNSHITSRLRLKNSKILLELYMYFKGHSFDVKISESIVSLFRNVDVETHLEAIAL